MNLKVVGSVGTTISSWDNYDIKIFGNNSNVFWL